MDIITLKDLLGRKTLKLRWNIANSPARVNKNSVLDTLLRNALK
jgi:hypothetical protein